MDVEISTLKAEKLDVPKILPTRRQHIEDILPFHNPLILASGPLGFDAKSLVKYSEFAGGVVTKTTTWDPCEGNPPPRVWKLPDSAMLNWEGGRNLGYERSLEEMRVAKQMCRCPVIASLWPGAGLKKLTIMAAGFEEAGADAIELDFKWGTGLDSEAIARICVELKKAVSIPLIAKLAVFGGNICENAKVVEDAGADAIVAINSIAPAMKIHIGRQRPVLSTEYGALSGKPILPFAVAAVYELYTTVAIPIIGSGGITRGEAALELILAGADALQIFTVVMTEGPTAFQRILNELETLVQKLGFGSIEECRGLAHRP